MKLNHTPKIRCVYPAQRFLTGRILVSPGSWIAAGGSSPLARFRFEFQLSVHVFLLPFSGCATALGPLNSQDNVSNLGAFSRTAQIQLIMLWLLYVSQRVLKKFAKFNVVEYMENPCQQFLIPPSALVLVFPSKAFSLFCGDTPNYHFRKYLDSGLLDSDQRTWWILSGQRD